MRVLMVGEQLRRRAPGGIGTYIRGLVGGLASVPGTSVDLLVSRPPGPADPVSELGVRVVASPLPAAVLSRAWAAGASRAPGGYDVVHAPSLATPPTRTPLAVAVHDLAWRAVPDAFTPRGRRWHDAALARATRRAAVILTPTTSAADEVVEAGARRGNVVVVEPMYGCDHLPAPDEDGASALLDGVGVRGPYLLSVGTLEPRKNLVRVIEAYTRARPRFLEPWPLVVAGPPGWGAPPPPAPGVVQVGAVPAGVLAALYAGARCVVYAPLLEGFGLPAVEAMACGVPVVASPMPSTGGAALEVDPLDVDAIAAALVDAALDEAVRAELTAAGRRRAGQLTWARAAERHAEVWGAVA